MCWFGAPVSVPLGCMLQPGSRRGRKKASWMLAGCRAQRMRECGKEWLGVYWGRGVGEGERERERERN